MSEVKSIMIKFISYDGEFPNLCRGILVLDLNGKRYEVKHALQPAGDACAGVIFNADGSSDTYCYSGYWEIDDYKLPEELKPFINEIKELVNENVSAPCCGGCI